MRITLIGAGNLATQLGKALSVAGHKIVQVYSRTSVSAEILANTIGGIATNNLSEINNEADIYIYALKDSVLRDVIKETSCNIGLDKILLHTAGSMSIDCFATESKAMHYGVLYPMQTFSKSRDVNFNEIPCFIESNDVYTDGKIRELAESISDNVYELSSEKRKYLHLSAVWACNFTNHCYTIASEMVGKCGLPFDVLFPLIDETARKVHDLSPQKAQTGPAIRYDDNVIKAQMELLGTDEMLTNIYMKMSKSIYQRNKIAEEKI